jgi:hypothetical protein
MVEGDRSLGARSPLTVPAFARGAFADQTVAAGQSPPLDLIGVARQGRTRQRDR